MRDTSWDTPYIHGRDRESNQSEATHNLQSTMTVFVNEQRIVYSPESFLQAAWTREFDTPCTICKDHFDIATEPPVRLLGLGTQVRITDLLRQALPALHVKNYHLSCLKRKNVRYIPASHPWHSSIAEAYALRTFDAKAAQICYETPLRTLMAVQHRFGPDCLLWHDYISIPQWNEDFRGTVILPQIFKIFETSGSSILHLEQHPPSEIIREPTLQMIERHTKDLQKFFNAHLFSRLWPIVEFDRAGEAYIMNDKYDILKLKFTVLVEQILDAIKMSDETDLLNHSNSIKLMNHLPLCLRERQETKCLGYVFDMIADLGCRSFRDKFIGTSELLGIPDYPTKLPEDEQNACLWIAKKQIERNDWSPLLLQPSGEPSFAKASWLKGHHSIIKNMWGWGTQLTPAERAPQIQNDSIILDVHLIGYVADYFTWTSLSEPPLDVLSGTVLQSVSSQIPAEEIIGRLEHIKIQEILDCENSVESPGSSELAFRCATLTSTRRALHSVISQMTWELCKKRSVYPTSLHKELKSLLILSASLPLPNLQHLENLDISSLRQQLSDQAESYLVLINCSDCGHQSSTRAQFWKPPTTKSKLYRVPDLTYQYTAAGGVGFFLDDDQIIGRARFCAPACNCNHSARVELT